MSQDINLIINCNQINCPYNHEKECGKEVLYINDSECVAQTESESGENHRCGENANDVEN